MSEYKQHTEKIDVPKGTGTRGFLHTIEAILKLDRVQNINIDARGNVVYTRFVREDALESSNIGPTLAFETLMPYACLRNGRIDELIVSPIDPSKAIARLFQRVTNEHLYPVAFVTGASTTLWEWFSACEGLEFDNKEELYGLPIFSDRHLEDYVLILASAYGRHAGLVDVQKSYKIIMPQRRESDALDRESRSQGRYSPEGDPDGIQALGLLGGDATRVPPTS